MTRPLRLLGGAFIPSSPFSEPDDEQSTNMGSDSALTLLALFCALVCVLGLIVVARCVWLRRHTSSTSSASSSSTEQGVDEEHPTLAPEAHLHGGLHFQVHRVRHLPHRVRRRGRDPGASAVRPPLPLGVHRRVAAIALVLPLLPSDSGRSNKCHKCGGFSSLG